MMSVASANSPPLSLTRRVMLAFKCDPCHWFRRSLALAPATPEAMETFQCRVAVNAVLQSARDGLKARQ
jgi:hypothetical protein